MGFDLHEHKIANRFPNAFQAYVRFFNPAKKEWHILNYPGATPYLPTDSTSLCTFFKSLGIYFEVKKWFEASGKKVFCYRLKIWENGTSRFIYHKHQQTLSGFANAWQMLEHAFETAFHVLENAMTHQLAELGIPI